MHYKFLLETTVQICTHLGADDEPVFADSETFKANEVVDFDVIEVKDHLAQVQFGDGSVAFIDKDSFEKDDYWEADWFDDEDQLLYIVPSDPYVESIGPDNETMDELDKLIRENGEITDEDVERLNLTRVSEILKRYSVEGGYYHA